MKMNRKMPGSVAVKAFLISAVIGITIMMLGAIFTATLIGTKVIELNDAGIAALLTLLLSSFVCAKVLLNNVKNVWLSTALVVLGHIVILAIGCVLVGEGFASCLRPSMLVIVAGAASAVLIPHKKKSNSYRR